MPKSPSSLRPNWDMDKVHALGHNNSPPPRTKWSRSARGRGGEPATIALPPSPNAPNGRGAISRAGGTGSALGGSGAPRAGEGSHDAAAGFALRSSPSG